MVDCESLPVNLPCKSLLLRKIHRASEIGVQQGVPGTCLYKIPTLAQRILLDDGQQRRNRLAFRA
jgi:hypothetical protein